MTRKHNYQSSSKSNFTQFGFHPIIQQNLDKSGYQNPTPIQSQALPHALLGRDLLISAQTGSGKTASFVLPLLEKLLQNPNKTKQPRGLIIVPTRELALQVQDSVRKYGAGLKWLFSIVLIGGSSYKPQINALKKGVSLIIATPGRLLDHIKSGNADLSKIEFLALDEADRMLDMGFADEINAIMQKIPKKRQTLMSSATWDGKVGKIALEFTQNPHTIKIKPQNHYIDEMAFFCDNQTHKKQILQRLILDAKNDPIIIFTNTKKEAEDLAINLKNDGYQANYLHGDLPQQKRSKIIKQMRSNKCQILVATDVAARGLDIPIIERVINYQLPKQNEDYVHRIGRCGRMQRKGIAQNLIELIEHRKFIQLNKYLNRKINIKTLDGLEPKKSIQTTKKPRKKPSFKKTKNKSRKTNKS